MGDRVFAARRVVEELGRIGWSSVISRSGPARGVPASVDRMTPEWLTRVLAPAFPGVRIATVECLDQDVGTTTRARLAVTYLSGIRGPQPPSTVFVKLTSSALGTRLIGNLNGLGSTEVAFYRRVGSDVPVRVPRTYHAASDRRFGTFVLVQEDLVASGCRFRAMSEPCTFDEVSAVVEGQARLHAAFWESPRFRADLRCLASLEHDPTAPLGRLITHVGMRRCFARHPAAVPVELRELGELVLAHRRELETAWNRNPRTLVHGDSHGGNVFFSPEGVGFLDWQLSRQCEGMRDVAYYLVTSVPTEVRVAHERELIVRYLDTLREHGADAPTFALAWEQYRLHAIYGFIAATVTAGIAGMQDEAVARVALDRACAALGALESSAAAWAAVADA